MYQEFQDRDTVVVAIAQEDKDVASFAKILPKFKGELPFEIVADVNREGTPLYDRTTTYLIDKEGIVREIFPALIHMRPTWHAVLHRLDEINLSD